MAVDYYARLMGDQGSAPATPAATPSPAPVDYYARLMQPQATQVSQPTPQLPHTLDQAAQEVTKDMGAIERATVGFGRGLTVAGRGVKQAALQAAGAFGLDTQPALDAMQAQETDEKRIFDAGVGKTAAGIAGAFAGEVAPTLFVPGGAVARGASLAQKSVAGAKLGGVLGGLQYVDPGESRLENAAQGAALGGIASGAIDLVAKGGARLANTLAGRSEQPIADVLALGKQHNVPVFAPDVAGSPVMGKVSTLAEDVPLVGMAKPRLQQAEAAAASAQAMMGRLATPVNDVGRTLQDSLSSRTQALQKLAGKRYDAVAKAADPLGAVPLNNLRTTAQRLLTEAKQDIDPSASLISRLEGIANTADGANFSQARLYRSNIGDEIRKLQSGSDLKSARPLQQIKAALEQDMNGFAQTAGGDVATKWKAADQFFKNRVMPQRESDIVRAMRNQHPDEVFKQFIRSGTQDRAQRLYNALGAKGRNAVKAGILEQAWQKAAQSGANGVAFSPAKFAGELERVQGSVGVFFKGADKAEIDGFTKLMRHVQRAGQVAENPPTGNRLVLPMLMGETLAPGTASTALATGGLARLLFTTEPGKRLLLASSRFPPGSQRLEHAIDRFRQKAPALVGSATD